MWSPRSLFAAALAGLFLFGPVGGATAQVRIDIPGHRPPGSDGPTAGDVIGGLLALKGGYDRSRRGRICVLTYDDANGDGVRDRKEGALPGWTFTFTDSAGRPVAQGVTDGKGRFCNEKPLAPGAYTVSETAGGDWINTDPGGWTAPVTLPADRSVVVLFGNCRGERCAPRGPTGPTGPVGPVPGPLPDAKFKARICVTKFEDTNGNGVRDGAEWTLASWQMTVRNGAGAVVATGWTNNQGEYCTAGTLTPGPYTVSETLMGGWISTTPGGVIRSLVLQLGQTWTWSFGNQRIPPTQVCIKKFNDLNGDGVRQSNEPGLGGWSFTVSGPTGPQFPMTTGVGGACDSGPYAAGAYTATETAQSGWVATTPGGAVQTFTLVPTHNISLLFGNRKVPATAAVCVTKYNDLNGNGARDAGEPVLPGWIFTVKNAAGAVIAFGTTNAQGKWCSLAALPAGPATVVETPKPGWISTDPGGALPTKTLTLVSGQTVNLAFGNRTPPPAVGQICVAKYYDLNSNGVYVSGEPLLPGWQFTITGPSGPVSLTTGTTGTACTPVNLLLGTYVVAETMKPGWSSTAPGGLAPQRTVTVAAGPNGTGVMFGNIHALPGQICVNKYHDVNRNGKRDAGEPPLAGWTFEIRSTAGVLLLTGVTDADGRYCTATSLPPGAYNVTEVPKPWWVATDPQGPPMASPPYDKTAILTAARGGEVHFGNIPAGRACILKYNDLNGNGHRDPGEPPLAGWSFKFRYQSWVAAASVVATTDAAGQLCVDLPPGGTHQVDEILQPGWTSTDPGPYTGTSNWVFKVFTIVEGQTTQLVFGNHQTAAPATARVCVTKYNDLNNNGVRDAGEPPLAGWAFVIKDAAGTIIAFGTTNKEGRFCSESKLPAGAVTVTETLLAGWLSTDPGGSTPTKTGTLSPGQTWSVVFGNRLATPAPSGKLCVHKFNDLNGDASYALSEPGLAGWQFTVTGPSGPITLTTGANGRACTNGNLIFGTYTITETPQAGWVSTLPGGATPQQTGAVTAAGIPSFNFGNRAVAPPPPPRLTISKSFDNSCASVMGVSNPCVFRIRILNVDTTTYAGPAAFSDTVGFMGGITVANSTLLTAPLPPGWSCSTNGPPISCSGAVNLAPGQFVDVVLTVNLFHPVMPLKNCVSLTVPISTGPVCIPF